MIDHGPFTSGKDNLESLSTTNSMLWLVTKRPEKLNCLDGALFASKPRASKCLHNVRIHLEILCVIDDSSYAQCPTLEMATEIILRTSHGYKARNQLPFSN